MARDANAGRVRSILIGVGVLMAFAMSLGIALTAGKDLPWWHPLKSGSRETVHQAGMSVAGRCISEKEAGELEEHVVYWLDHRGPPKPPR